MGSNTEIVWIVATQQTILHSKSRLFFADASLDALKNEQSIFILAQLYKNVQNTLIAQTIEIGKNLKNYKLYCTVFKSYIRDENGKLP